MNRRAEILHQLAEFQTPPGPLLAELRTFGFYEWTEPPLLVLNADHFRNVLNRYLSGAIAAKQLQDWAECLERRDDVGFDPSVAEVLDEIQFRLANPEINGGISTAVVTGMLEELG